MPLHSLIRAQRGSPGRVRICWYIGNCEASSWTPCWTTWADAAGPSIQQASSSISDKRHHDPNLNYRCSTEMSRAAWRSRHCGPCLHCDSRVAVRRSRVHCPRIQGLLAPVETSQRSLVHSHPSPGGDDASLQRGGLLQALRTGMASAGQLLRLSSRDSAVASSEQSFKDVERLRLLGGEAKERGLQV